MDDKDPYAKFDQADPYAKFGKSKDPYAKFGDSSSSTSKPSITQDTDGKFAQYAKDFRSGLAGTASSVAAALGQYGAANKINDWAAPSMDMQRGDEEAAAKSKAVENGSALDKAGAVVGGFVSNLGHNVAHMAGGLIAPAALGVVAPEAVPLLFGGQAAGDAKLAIYNRNKQAYLDKGMPDSEADKQASLDAEYTGKNALGIGTSAAVGVAAGKFGTGGQIATIGKGLKDKALAEATAQRIAGRSLGVNIAEEGAVQGAVGGAQGVSGSFAQNQAADNANLDAHKEDYLTSFFKGAVPGVALGSAFGAGHKLLANAPESVKDRMTPEQLDAELASDRIQSPPASEAVESQERSEPGQVIQDSITADPVTQQLKDQQLKDQDQNLDDKQARILEPEEDIFGGHAGATEGDSAFTADQVKPTAIDALQNKSVELGDGAASRVFASIPPDAQLEVAGKVDKTTGLADSSTATQDHANSVNEGQKQGVLEDQRAQDKAFRNAEALRQKVSEMNPVGKAKHAIKTGDMDLLTSQSEEIHQDALSGLIKNAANVNNLDAIDHLVSLDQSQGLEISKNAAKSAEKTLGISTAQPIHDSIARLHEGKPEEVTMTSKDVADRQSEINDTIRRAEKDAKKKASEIKQGEKLKADQAAKSEINPAFESDNSEVNTWRKDAQYDYADKLQEEQERAATALNDRVARLRNEKSDAEGGNFVKEEKPVDQTKRAFDAIKSGDEAGATDAVKNGASLEDSVSTSNGRFPALVHQASAKGMVNLLKAIENRDPGHIASNVDYMGNHALTYAKDAVTARHIMSVDENAVHVKNNNESNPLHQAQNIEVAREMLSHGADIHAINKDGFTPEQSHANYGRPDIAETIRPYRVAKEEAAALKEHVAAPEEVPSPRKVRRLEVGDSNGESASGPTHSKEELTGRVKDILNNKTKGLGDAITKSDLFKVVDRESSKTDGSTHGYVDSDGIVGVVHDNIPKSWSDDQVYGLLKHEIGIHAVLSAVGKEKMGQLLEHFKKLVESGDKDAKAAMERVPEGTKTEHVQEEGLAYYVQNAKDPSVMDRIGIAMKQMVRSFTRGMGVPEKGAVMRWINSMSGKDLNQMAGDAIKEFANKRDGMVNASERRLSKAEEKPERAIDKVKQRKGMAYGGKSKESLMDTLHGKSQSAKEFIRRYIDQYVDLDRLVQKDRLVLGDKFDHDLDPTHARLTEGNKAGRSIEVMNKDVLEPVMQHLAETKMDPKALDDGWAGFHYGNKVEGSRYMTREESTKALGFELKGKTEAEAFKELKTNRPKIGKAAELFNKTKSGRNGNVPVAERLKAYFEFMSKNELKEAEVHDAWNAVVSEQSRLFSSLSSRAQSREALGFDKSKMTQDQALTKLDEVNPNLAKGIRLLQKMNEDTKRVYDEAGIVKRVSSEGVSPAKQSMAEMVLAAHRARSEIADNNLKLSIAKYFEKAHSEDNLMHTEEKGAPDSTRESGDHVVPYMESGVERQMVFDKGDKDMMGLGKGLNHQEKMDDLMISQAGRLTRFVSNVHTHWAPVFFIKHGIRNMIHGAIAAGYDKRLEGKWTDVVKHAMGSSKMIFDSAMGNDMAKYGEEGKLYQKFRDMGGEAIFALSPKSADEEVADIKRNLYPTPQRKAWEKVTGGYLHLIHALTHSAENNVRFALFKTALENNIPEKQAINLSRNATVNFNTRGRNTSTASKLYGFFNANIQGTASLGRIMFDRDVKGNISLNKKGKQILIGGILTGFAAGMEQRVAGIKSGTVSETELDENLVIGVDGKAVKVPLALGLNVPFAIGRIIAEGVHEGHPMDRIANAINATLKGFLPIGSSGLSAANTYAPTPIDGIISLAANDNGMGGSIHKSDNPTTPTTGSSRNKDNDSAVAKGIAAIINYATGGSEYKPGHVSPTSSDIDFLLNQYAPIPWSMINKFIDGVKGVKDGKPMELSDVPVVSQYVKDTEGKQATQSVYIAHEKEINTYLAGLKQIEAVPGSNVGKYVSENPVSARAADMYRETNKALQEMHTQIKEIKLRADAPDASSEAKDNSKKIIFTLQEKATIQQKRFNERMEQIEKTTKY